MRQAEAQNIITRNLRGECLQDLAEYLDISYSCLLRWRDNAPGNPSLRVFVKLVNHYGLPLGIWELEVLL